MNTSPTANQEVVKKQPFSPETLKALQELGEIFRQIHRRLVSEGYIIRDGKIIKPGSDDDTDGVKS